MMQEKSPADKKNEKGPFDIIGDIHGCYDELKQLLLMLGYSIDENLIALNQCAVRAPAKRRVIFVGDLVDRGPKAIAVLALVMNMVQHQVAFCVPGNHDEKLSRYLKGNKVQLKHGLEVTAQDFSTASQQFKDDVIKFIDSLVSHYIFDQGKLVVAHAGMKELLQGKLTARTKSFALYGETSSHLDENGLPIRLNWAKDYQGTALVVYGHTPTSTPTWLNNTICIDTGCVFGGKLTALRYPERELISVMAEAIYYPPSKHF